MADAIAAKQLQEGDVLLYHGTALMSRAIQLFDGTEVSHAALYLGNHRAGEARAAGLTEQTLEESSRGSEYLLVRRLKSGPAMEPVLATARNYLNQGNRYAYEQILLLAILSLSRKLKITPSLRVLLRRLLDAAASFLNKLVSDKLGEQREPMICSEFVYRAYDEALPEQKDAYSLEIGGISPDGTRALRQRDELFRDVDLAALVPASRIHPESLLAWALSPTRSWSEPLAGATKRPRAAAPVSRAGLDGDVEDAIERYLDEVKQTSRALEPSDGSVSDTEVIERIHNFATALHIASIGGVLGPKARRRATRARSRAIVGDARAALANLLHTAADFVTPGDLLKCESLYTVGQLGGTKGVAAGLKRELTAIKARPLKRALLVGINHYTDPRNNLKGCVNDVLLMSKILMEHYRFDGDQIRMLTDERATTRNIRQRLDWLVDDVGPGSVLVFHYSGHGSQVRDRHGDELDDLDEILCPYDLDWDDPLTDDELARIVGKIPDGVNFTIVLDCCHSGTGTREFYRDPGAVGALAPRCLTPPPDIGFRAANTIKTQLERADRTISMFGRRVQKRKRFGAVVTKQKALVLAACRDRQTSADDWIDNDYHGVFTYSLWTALNARNFSLPSQQLVAEAEKWLRARGYEQTPQIEGPAGQMRQPFLKPLRSAHRRASA